MYDLPHLELKVYGLDHSKMVWAKEACRATILLIISSLHYT